MNTVKQQISNMIKKECGSEFADEGYTDNQIAKWVDAFNEKQITGQVAIRYAYEAGMISHYDIGLLITQLWHGIIEE